MEEQIKFKEEQAPEIVTKLLKALEDLSLDKKVMLLPGGTDLELIDVQIKEEYLAKSKELAKIENGQNVSQSEYDRLHEDFMKTREERLALDPKYTLLYVDKEDEKDFLRKIIPIDKEFSVKEIQIALMHFVKN